MNLENTFEVQRLAKEILNVANKEIREAGYRVLDEMNPLTYEELDALLNTDEHEMYGTVVWVQMLPHKFTYAAVLDWFKGEVIAVYGASVGGCDNQLYGRNYGTEWVAYLDKPVFDNE